MWPYLLMFGVSASFALAESACLTGGRSRLAWLTVIVVLTLVIGYRFQVGGDWETYLFMFNRSSQADLVDYLSEGDPSYQLLNWISNRLGWGIYGVNLVTGAIFSYGLASFCRTQLRPWLALAVAVPYLVIVVGMGYSRQAAALGLEMLALNALANRRITTFIFFVMAAASFHKTAIIIMLLLILVAKNLQQMYIFIALFALLGIASLSYTMSAADTYMRAYLDTSYDSQGAAIRLILNFVPSALTLAWQNKLGYDQSQKRLWLCFSMLSIFCVIILFFSPSSTAVDRVALYLLPLQIAIFSRLPLLAAVNIQRGRQVHLLHPVATFATAIVLVSYGIVEVVWLTRAQTAFAWLPYRSYLFERII